MPSLIDHLDRLRRHSAWADARLLAALEAAPSPVPDAARELAHVRGAQETWLARLTGRRPALEVWPHLPTGELARVGATLDAALTDLITRTSEEELARTFSYRNSAGVELESAVGDALLHLFLHSQYHRGKANAALRAAGAAPVQVDFIVWCRLGTDVA